MVEDPERWAGTPVELPGAEIVSAHHYLTDAGLTDVKRVRVFNLCEDYAYQTTGYYVSLLAEARGHRPLPSVTTLEDFRGGAARMRHVTGEIQNLAEKALASIGSDRFTLSVYFGRNLAKRYDRLAHALFEYFPAPLLRCEFARVESKDGRRWRATRILPIALGDVPPSHRDFLGEQAARFFTRPRITGPKPVRADIAVLVDPDEPDAPSDAKALDRFARAAKKEGVRVETIGAEDYGRIGEYDGLFIRATTAVNHYTYRFARRAEAEGVVVVDDPRSIVRCTNKVFQAELFERHRIPCPKTMIVHAENVDVAAERLGFPMVLKQPDSAFSRGVVKARDPEELTREAGRLLETSELIVAQAFLRSEFDWRVGVLDGTPLWLCRYHFPKGHWQIQDNREGQKPRYGRHETLPIEEAPPAVLETAIRAANLVGDGFYGVDLKEIGGIPHVMEVNDNPNLDAGVEDTIGKDGIYRALVRWFLERIEARGKATDRKSTR